MPVEPPYVIVTGSSGLLGQRVCLRLAEAGYEVFGFDRVGMPEPPKQHPRVHDLECDVTDFNTVQHAVDAVGQTLGQLREVVSQQVQDRIIAEVDKRVVDEPVDRLAERFVIR